MFQRSIFLACVAICSQLLYVSSTDCLGEYLTNKFETCEFQPNTQLKPLRFNGSNFYFKADIKINNLTLTEFSNKPILNTVKQFLQLSHPEIDIYSSWTSKLVLTGTHMTNGTILAKTPVHGNGHFNVTIGFIAGFVTRVTDIQPTSEGYLKAQRIQTTFNKEHYNSNSTFYLEGVTDNNTTEKYLEDAKFVYSYLERSITFQMFSQTILSINKFWKKRISETKLEDICITF